MPVVQGKEDFGNRDNQKFDPFMESLDYQRTGSRMKLSEFSTDSASTIIPLSIEILVEEISPINTEKSFSEHHK